MDEETGYCFNKCNELFPHAIDPKRSYCKKGCKSDFEMEECREKTCSKLCVKEELGTDESKWGNWSKVFSRAPADSADCLEACFTGCINKISSDDKN
jgi:hypothetical protein